MRTSVHKFQTEEGIEIDLDEDTAYQIVNTEVTRCVNTHEVPAYTTYLRFMHTVVAL